MIAEFIPYRCECSDLGCKNHLNTPTCNAPGRATVFPLYEYPLSTYFVFCWDCADDALSSGVFGCKKEEL